MFDDCLESYLEEGYLGYFLEEEDPLGDFCEGGSLREDSPRGSTDICLGPEGGRGELTGGWLVRNCWSMMVIIVRTRIAHLTVDTLE